MLASRAQIAAAVLTTIKFIHGDIHCVLEFSSLILIKIDRCDALAPGCIALTPEGPASRLASRKFSDGNMSTATHYTVPSLALSGQTDTEIIKAVSSTSCIHVGRTHASLANRGNRVTQILIAEQNVLIFVS